MAQSSSRPILRLRLEVQTSYLIPVDRTKLATFNQGKKRTANLTENAIVKAIAEGEMTEEQIAEALGGGDIDDAYDDGEVQATLEGHCEIHDLWFPMNNTSVANCWKCKSENLPEPKEVSDGACTP